MDNLLVLTLCTQSLHRLHGQFVGTHIVHIEPTQVAWAIRWYPHCAHRVQIGGMGNLLVPTLALCAQCEYQQISHATYVGPMCTMWVPTNCPRSLCRLYVHNVSTNKLSMQPMQALCVQCEYQQIAHATYVGPMCTMWVPTNCPCNLCSAHRAYIGCVGNLLVPTLCTQGLHRLHGKFVGTHIVHIEPTQVAWAIRWYPHCAHRAYIGCMGNLLVLTLYTQGLHRLHGQFVGTHIVHIEPTQVAWAICWYSHCAHRAYIGCMGNLLVPTLSTQGLHRLHGQFVGTHIVHIGPTQVAQDNLLVLTLCTQSLHRLHGQFVGTHIVHIGPTQVAWAICWYPHCAHRAYIGCLGNLLVPTLCTQGLHGVAQAICWDSHCEHSAHIGCMGNLLVPTL